MSARPPDDELVAALGAALAPYPWRCFTPELLARFALAARDRQEVAAALAAVEGAEIGAWERLEPADRGDPRVSQAAELLADLRWAGATLLATCRDVVDRLGREPRWR